MDVNGPAPIRPSIPLQSVGATGNVSGTSGSGAVVPQDQLQISDAARLMEEIDSTSELHQARLEQIKTEIQNGTYETPEKLEAALLKLMQAFDSQP